MTDLAVETAALTPRRKANGAAGPVKIKPQAPARFTIDDAWGEDRHEVIQVNGKPLSVVWNPDRISHRQMQEIAAFGRDFNSDEPDIRSTEWIIDMLSPQLVSWEFYYPADAGEPYPTTPEALRELPDKFLMEVLNKLQEKLVPPAPATPSSSFTGGEGKEGVGPTGTS